MRKGVLAALATATLMNGCAMAPYGYKSGPAGYREFDARVGPPDVYPGDRDAYRDRRTDRDDRDYRRPLPGRERSRVQFDRCRPNDPRDCTPQPDSFFVQPLPPDYGRTPRQAPAVAAPSGTWRVQLGVFRQPSRAAGLRAKVAGISALSAYQTYLVSTGGLTRVQAGPLPSAAAANTVCARTRAAGHDCIVKAI